MENYWEWIADNFILERCSSEISRKLLDRVDRNRILICNAFENDCPESAFEKADFSPRLRHLLGRHLFVGRGKYLYGVEEEEVKRGTFPEFDRVEGEESRVTPADTFVKIGTCHEIFRNLLLRSFRRADGVIGKRYHTFLRYRWNCTRWRIHDRFKWRMIIRCDTRSISRNCHRVIVISSTSICRWLDCHSFFLFLCKIERFCEMHLI